MKNVFNALKIKSKNNLISVIYLVVFCFSYIIFKDYQDYLIPDNLFLIIFINTLILFLYLISLLRIKLALYIFIFLIPLLNSLPKIINTIEFDVILLLFFPLWLGFIVKKISNYYASNDLTIKNIFTFDLDFNLPILLFIFLIFISSAISIWRYANFYPFITNKYYNLVVNYNGFSSTQSISWVLHFFFNFLSGFLFLYLIYNVIRTRKDIINLMLVLISSTVLSSFVLGYQYFLNPTFGNLEVWANSGRFNATFSDPNSLGNFIVLLFPVLLVLIFYFKRWSKKIIFFILLIIIISMAFMSGSRSAFMGIVLSILIIFIINFFRVKLWFRKRRKIGFIVIGIVFVFAVAFILALIGKIAGNTGVITKLSESINTILRYWKKDGFIEAIKAISNYRYIYWQQAVWMFKDYPLTGVGLGTYVTELPQYIIKTGVNFWEIDFAGNYYLQILAELGISGFILTAYIFYLVIKKGFGSFKKNSKDKLMISGLLSSFISMLVVFNLGAHANIIEVQFTFWLVIGLIIVFVKINSQKPLLINFSNSNITKIISFSIIIIIFTVNLLAASFGDLSTNIKQVKYGWENKYGFYQEITVDGKKCKWTSIDASQVIRKNGNKMILTMKALNPDIRNNALYIKIYLNNNLVKEVKFNDSQWHDILVNVSNIERGNFTLTLSCSRSWIPREWDYSSSEKELGILLGKIKFTDNF